MEHDTAQSEPTFRRRVKLWSREIAVAVLLTLAALMFITMARLSNGGDADKTPAQGQGPATSFSRK